MWPPGTKLLLFLTHPARTPGVCNESLNERNKSSRLTFVNRGCIKSHKRVKIYVIFLFFAGICLTNTNYKTFFFLRGIGLYFPLQRLGKWYHWFKLVCLKNILWSQNVQLLNKKKYRVILVISLFTAKKKCPFHNFCQVTKKVWFGFFV